jgi:hypothetical protein
MYEAYGNWVPASVRATKMATPYSARVATLAALARGSAPVGRAPACGARFGAWGAAMRNPAPEPLRIWATRPGAWGREWRSYSSFVTPGMGTG